MGVKRKETLLPSFLSYPQTQQRMTSFMLIFGLLFWSSVWFDKPYHVFCGLKQHRIQLPPQLGLLRVCERRIVGGLCHSNMGTAFRHSDTQRWNFSQIWGTSKFWSFPKCSSLFFWLFELLVCNTDYLSYFTRLWKEIFSWKCSLIPTKSSTVFSSHAHLLPPMHIFFLPCTSSSSFFDPLSFLFCKTLLNTSKSLGEVFSL